jgi:hypothetical protein
MAALHLDDASTAPHVPRLSSAIRARDARIRVVYRERTAYFGQYQFGAGTRDRGICVAARFRRRVDTHALFWVVNEILDHPEADIVYSDEDKLDATAGATSPYFNRTGIRR